MRGSRLWRIAAIAASIVLVICLAAVLVWFFADPLHLPDQVLQVLDQRASVAGMFSGMALGAAALVVSVVALRAQPRAEYAPAQAEQQGTPSPPPAVSASGDGARNVRMQAEASGQGRVYQASGNQSINEGDDRRAYGGDHIEFHHNTFHDKVVGKQVNGSTPIAPGGDGDGRR